MRAVLFSLFLMIFACGVPFFHALAQEITATTEPAPTVETNPLEKIESLSNAFIVMELFTSQACVFCPKADAFIKDFIALDHVIALSCHVDYFNVKVGSLSLPECGKRQEMFESVLRAGPKFTPQMIINGADGMVGYRQADIWRALDKAVLAPAGAGSISQADGALFDLTLPEVNGKNLSLYLIAYDHPKTVEIKDGGNKGKTMTYYNVVSSVSDLGKWNGDIKALRLTFDRKEQNAGFAILGQDPQTGKILAAAKYTFPTTGQ